MVFLIHIELRCTVNHTSDLLRTVPICVIMQQVIVIPYRCFGTTYWSHLQGPRIQKESSLSKYGVIIGKSVASDKFSVAWCQPIGLMQLAGKEGECSTHSSAVLFWDIPSFSAGGSYVYQITRFCNDLNSKVVKCRVQLKHDGTQ